MDIPKNQRRPIEVGRAILPWAPATNPRDKEPVPAGWVLPGGQRETEYWRALEAAKLMDSILRGEVPMGPQHG